MSVFDLTEIQANYILDMPLRRLTKFSKIELDKEADELERTIEELDAILGDDARLRKVVSDELAEVAKTYGTPASHGPARVGRPDRHRVGHAARGRRRPLLRVPVLHRPARAYDDRRPARRRRRPHPPRRDRLRGRHHRPRRGRRGHLGAAGWSSSACSTCPTLPSTANHPNLQGGAPVGEFLSLEPASGCWR